MLDMETPSFQENPDYIETIENIINSEKEQKKLKKELENQIQQGILSELGNFIEEPYTIIESYFKGQELQRLVRHQIESYNQFVNYQIQRTIQMFNQVVIRSENDYVEEQDKYLLEILISFEI